MLKAALGLTFSCNIQNITFFLFNLAKSDYQGENLRYMQNPLVLIYKRFYLSRSGKSKITNKVFKTNMAYV